jgi:hypothetical protein
VYQADWTDVQAYLLVAQGGGHQQYEIAAYVGGSLTLESTSLDFGAPVVGSMDLVVWGGQP